jgi:hypothetical protein
MFMNHGSSRSSKTVTYMAGFGTEKSKASKAPPKLKPKTQWDRYTDLKKSTSIPVAVRVIRQDGDHITYSEWMKVGQVKSDEDQFTEMAVLAQRALLADHAKRLYPLQVLGKEKVEWAFMDKGEWMWVQKDASMEIPPGIERKIGFEGTPDPSSGFYCHYVDGRIE